MKGEMDYSDGQILRKKREYPKEGSKPRGSIAQSWMRKKVRIATP